MTSFRPFRTAIERADLEIAILASELGVPLGASTPPPRPATEESPAVRRPYTRPRLEPWPRR